MPPLTVDSLTPQEKVSLLHGFDFWRTRPLPAHDLPSLWLSDGPHGLRTPASSASVGLSDAQPATCFPTAVALASSWDPQLLEEVGRALGAEARARGVHVLLGPGLNIKRHPQGGRCFEYFSEDPLLSGQLAAAMVRGIQSQGVGACLKHFAANNQEDHRMVIDALVDERSLRELYLRGFEIAVEQGAPATVMAAYNKLNGSYACEHRELLQGILRDEWGFDGLVMSDWGATNDRVAALAAGMDLEMPTSHGRQDALLLQALQEGRLDPSALDRSVRRLLELHARYGSPGPAPAPDLDAHHALARRAAAASCVLLRNEDGLLPLQPGARIAVLGALAKEPRYQGTGSSSVTPTRLVSAWAALSQDFPDITYAAGYSLNTDEPQAELQEEALRIAREADVVLVFAGLPRDYESEGFDRPHIRLPPSHDALIEAVAQACPRVAVVLSNGAPVDMPWVQRVDAAVEAYLGGQASGEGVADVLTGRVNPAGKLAESFAKRVDDHASHAFFPGDTQHVAYREGLYVGYRYLDSVGIAPLFPFGHGLSYTRFSYADLDVEVRGQEVSVLLRLENSGERAGAEVVQLYVRDVRSTVYRPLQELRAFQRVLLEPGESRALRFSLDRRAFAVWDAGRHAWQVEAGEFEIRIGASSRDIRLRQVVELASGDGPFQAQAPSCYHQPSHPLRPTDRDFARLLRRELPEPRPSRPFTRTTTLGELRSTLLGGLLFRLGVRKARAMLDAGDNPQLLRLAEASVREMPIRAMVTTAGLLSWRQLDGLLALLEGRPLAALRILLGRGRRRTA